MGKYNAMRDTESMTLFSDASFHDPSGAMGWGGWYRRSSMEKGRIVGGSRVLENGTVNDAEAIGMLETLKDAEAQGHLEDLDTIQLQCDNSSVLQAVYTYVPGTVHNKHKTDGDADLYETKKPLESKSAEIKALVEYILDLDERQGIAFQVRHIRGHQKGEGRRWVNKICDKVAYERMAIARKKMT